MPAPRVTIPELPEATFLEGDELIVIQDGATTKQVTSSLLIAAGGGISAKEAVDAVGAAMVGGDNVDVVYNEAAGSITVAAHLDTFIDVADYGVVGDGVSDDTAALQAFLDASPTRAHYLRTPAVVYRTTSTLTIPDAAGYHLYGESRVHSVIEADFNNAAILKTSGTFQHSYCFEHFGLRYKTAQPSTATNAVGLLLDGIATPTTGGTNAWFFYWSTLQHLRIVGAYKGIAVKQVAGEVQNVWNVTFEDLDFDDISGSLINLRSALNWGMPYNYFKMIRCLNIGAPYVNTEAALVVDGEYIMDAIDIEDWYGTVVTSAFGQGTIRGVHVERHHAVGSDRIFNLYGTSYMVDQYIVDYASATGGSYIFWIGSAATGGAFHLGTGHITSHNATAGGSIALLIADVAPVAPVIDIPQMPSHAGNANWYGLYYPWETVPTLLTNHGSVTWDPASMNTNTQTSTTVPVPGAKIGDVVAVGFSVAVPAGVLLAGSVTANDVVTVTMMNHTAGTVDLGSGTLRARIWKAL